MLLHCWDLIILLIFLNANLDATLDNLETIKSKTSLLLFKNSLHRNGDETLWFSSQNEVLILLHYSHWIALLILLNATWDMILDYLETFKSNASLFLFKCYWSGNADEMLWLASQNEFLMPLHCWRWISLLLILNVSWDAILDNLETVKSKTSLFLF